MKNVLIIDDDTELCELLREYLEREGYLVQSVHDGEQGAERALDAGISLVVLDVMLPGLNGFDVLRRIRARSPVPVIMLTARGEEVDRIVGLEIGADDYLAKPFNPRELAARMNAILRRSEAGALKLILAGAKLLRLGDLTIDLGSRTVRRAGETVDLTGVEFALLEILVRSAGEVVRRDKLTREVLDRRPSPFDRSLDVHVSNLRRKLGPSAGGEERIKTVRGRGYLYVRAVDSPTAEGDTL